MNIFWEGKQQLNIMEANSKASTANNKAQRANTKLSQLEQKVNHLSIACQAMWEILKEKSKVSEKEIEEKIIEIDLRDGRADGKISTTIVECFQCNRKINSTKKSCFYCGTPIKKTHLFE